MAQGHCLEAGIKPPQETSWLPHRLSRLQAKLLLVWIRNTPPHLHNTIMVIGLLTITAIPTITGVGEAVSAQKRQNAASKEQEKIHLAASFVGEGPLSDAMPTCFLKDGKVSATAGVLVPIWKEFFLFSG